MLPETKQVSERMFGYANAIAASLGLARTSAFKYQIAVL
jgi:hypothetical protein